MHINLDDFLDTGSGRIWTPERNVEAWKQSFAALAIALEQATDKTTVYVLIGAQASGKTTWARAKAAEDSDCRPVRRDPGQEIGTSADLEVRSRSGRAGYRGLVEDDARRLCPRRHRVANQVVTIA